MSAGSASAFIIYAPIAQLVEQLPFKETVEGSNPSGRTREIATYSQIEDLNKSGIVPPFYDSIRLTIGKRPRCLSRPFGSKFCKR